MQQHARLLRSLMEGHSACCCFGFIDDGSKKPRAATRPRHVQPRLVFRPAYWATVQALLAGAHSTGSSTSFKRSGAGAKGG